jgi:hypothetical protein
MAICNRLSKPIKGLCAEREWAAGAAVALALTLLMGVIYFYLTASSAILAWLGRNLLLNGLMLGAGTLLLVTLILGLLCISSSGCAQEQDAA